MANKSGHSGFNSSQAHKAKAMGVKASGGGMPSLAPNRAQGIGRSTASVPVPAPPTGKMPC